jgi:hypothetical protein
VSSTCTDKPRPLHSGSFSDMAREGDPRAERRLPELPADAWGAIARAALHAENDDVQTWAQLSCVNSTWRAALQGVT